MAVEHLEVERKFDVDAGFVLPGLGGLPGVAVVREPVEHLLEAAYHDTPDLRLARARVTLRRRTGGTDAGWHVKLPAAAGARRELHSPAGRAARTPPRAVLEPVLGIVREAPVGQVAQLRTRRLVTELVDAGGRVLAEVADDSVTGTAFPAAPGEPAVVTTWRELEVELVDGDEELLAATAAALVEAGARPAGSPSKLARVLADRLAASTPAPAVEPAPPGKKSKRSPDVAPAGAVVADALRAQVQSLQDADLMVRTGQPDGVHQVRVACRRLRSTLAALRPVLDRGRTEPLREELAVLGAELSASRDGEVALAHLRDLVAAEPVELVLGPVAARLQQAQLKDAQAGAARARRTLAGAGYLRLRDDLDALVADPPLTEEAGRPADAVLREVLHATGRRLRRAVDAAEGADAPEALHDVRKAAKRLRYTAEVAAPVLGNRVAELVSALKAVQDVLGERQDTFVTRPLCTRLGRQAHAAGENGWTWGRLHALEQARCERAEREFWLRWPELRRAVKRATR